MAESAVPDVLAPGPALHLLRDQPRISLGGRGSALCEPAQRLLAAPRRRGPHATGSSYLRSKWEMLGLGYGLTNAAYRTTKGKRRLCAAATSPAPASGSSASRRSSGRRMIAFVGKSAYEGVFRERPEHGLQERRLGETPALRPPLDFAGQRGGALRGEAPLVSRPSRRARATRHIRARGVSWERSRSRRTGGWHDPPTNACSICRGWNDDRTDLDWGGGRSSWSLCGRDAPRLGGKRRHRRGVDRRLGHGPAALRCRGTRSHARPHRTRA